MNYDLEDFIREIADEKGEKIPQDDIKDSLEEKIASIGKEKYREVKNDPSLLEEYHSKINSFRERLDEDWGEAIDLLELLAVRCTYIGAEIIEEECLKDDVDNLMTAYTFLHARACEVTHEIISLLRNGFPDGALARWRLLHEIVAVMLFLKENEDNEVVERFLNYATVEDKKFVEDYQEHCDTLGYEEIGEETIEKINQRIEILKEEYGEKYESRYGWARPGFPQSQGRMRKMRKEVGLWHYQPFYRLACESVHSSVRSTLNQTGLIQLPDELSREINFALSGPVNAGLSYPGQLAAIGIAQATAILINTNPRFSILVEMKINELLVEDIENSFADIEEEIYSREVDFRKQELEMDIVDIVHIYLGVKKVLTDEFVKENTNLCSFEDLNKAAPVNLEKETKISDEDRDQVDSFIKKHSKQMDTYFDLIDEGMLRFVEREGIIE